MYDFGKLAWWAGLIGVGVGLLLAACCFGGWAWLVR